MKGICEELDELQDTQKLKGGHCIQFPLFRLLLINDFPDEDAPETATQRSWHFDNDPTWSILDHTVDSPVSVSEFVDLIDALSESGRHTFVRLWYKHH